MIEFHYSLSKKQSSNTSNAIAVQIPLRLAFGATAHKVQGGTVKKPKMLVLDLSTVMEAAQAYVMLSRVQSRSQLIHLDGVFENKFYACDIALKELQSMTIRAINTHQPWKVITSCNIRSLSCHFKELLSTPNILRSNVICLQETWLERYSSFQVDIEGFKPHYNNVARGKGIVTFYRDRYEVEGDVKQMLFKMTKVSCEEHWRRFF